MSKESGLGLKYWKTSQTFPGEHIKQQWAEGKSITSVAYGGGLWAVITSKGVPYGSQTYSLSAKFPDEFVKQYWNDGHHITSMAYGHGHWAVVMSIDSGFRWQSWKTSVEFPNDWIKEHWDKGYDITSVTHGAGLWGVVMSKQLRDDPDKKGFLGVAVVDAKDGQKGALVDDTVADSPAAKAGIQKHDVIVAIDGVTTGDSTEMLDRVKTYAAGKSIQVRIIREGKTKDLRVTLGGVTLSVERHYGAQYWETRSLFPVQFVEDRWDDGHYITSIGFGGGLWAVVMSKEDVPQISKVPDLPADYFYELEP
jgi:hypothetical protein